MIKAPLEGSSRAAGEGWLGLLYVLPLAATLRRRAQGGRHTAGSSSFFVTKKGSEKGARYFR